MKNFIIICIPIILFILICMGIYMIHLSSNDTCIGWSFFIVICFISGLAWISFLNDKWEDL